jgi:hypothetical protein
MGVIGSTYHCGITLAVVVVILNIHYYIYTMCIYDLLLSHHIINSY